VAKGSLDLSARGRNFAKQIQDLLNKTVCDTAKVRSTDIPERQQVIVGTRLGDELPLIAAPVGIGLNRRKKPRVWLTVQYTCFLDNADYLTVYTSVFAVSASADDESMMLCHYDYEREKDGYPAAHLQVAGTSPGFAAVADLCDRKPSDLKKLHFPVGGRRFRPCLEDVIEFMVGEGLAAGRRGWKAVVEAKREEFLENQLRAAVRRYPEVAIKVLKKHPPS